MSTEHLQKRIDEILLQQGKVSESEIAAALNRQKALGGMLCSHLFENSSATEEDLVEALSKQLGLPGVVLSGLKIGPEVLQLISSNVAYARRVLPFAFDADRNVVKVACVDPADTCLLTELNYILGDKTVELYVSVELALHRAIDNYYGSRISGAEGSSQPDGTVKEHARSTISSPLPVPVNQKKAKAKSALLVTHQASVSQLLKVVLEKEGYQVQHLDSADKAVDIIQRSHFGLIFIQKGVPGNSLDLTNRLKITSPATQVRHFGSLADLLIDGPRTSNDISKLQQKLDLFTSLLTIKERVPRSHSSMVGYLVDRMCRRLTLTDEQRVSVLSAAYLHDRAKFYYMSATTRNFRLLIDLVIRLLQSVYYEPAVIEILRSMYGDLSQRPLDEVPFNVIASNILTVVDLYCETLPPSRQLTLDKLEEFRRSIEHRVGHLLLPRVFDTFIALMEQEAVNTPNLPRRGQIMFYSRAPELVFALESRLKSDGFRTIGTFSLWSFVRLYRRSRPDLLIIHIDGPPRSVIAAIKELKESGVDLKSTPTFVLAKQNVIDALTPLLEWGVEDILDFETDPDQIVFKINKTWIRMDICPKSPNADEEHFASKGNLSDMNLAELLQVLGPSRRTMKITAVPSAHPSDMLEIYLERGDLVYAALNNYQGAEAIYIGLTWDDGTWTVEPISEHERRQHNIQLSNEAILLEGCRLMDEKEWANLTNPVGKD
jgi:DNA-binding response OmpR family regulator